MTLLLIFLLALVASFIQRVSGFGFGIFVMMFFPFFLPGYGESVMLSGLLAGTTALMIAVKNWKYIRWRMMGVVLFFNILFSFLATEYMTSLSNETLKRCLGVVLILIAFYFLFSEGKKMKVLMHSKWTQGVIGSISGVMGGMFAMPGPPLVIYCINSLADKREYVSTLQAFSVMCNVFYTFFRAKVGFYSEDTFIWWGVGLLGGMVGTSIGTCLFNYISNNILRRIVYGLMIVSGLMAII